MAVLAGRRVVPMLGQNHHFNHFAPQAIPYAIEYQVKRNAYTTSLNKRPKPSPWLAKRGDHYSIADIASWSWVNAQASANRS